MSILIVIIALVLAIIVGKDANKRGMNGTLWGIGTFLCPLILILIYLVVRDDIKVEKK